MAELDRRGLVILPTEECLGLLRPGGVGRLGWVRADRPMIRPVNFALDGRRIVVRTGGGTIFAAAVASLPVTFEVDHVRNVDHAGWSVIVDGTIGLFDGDGVPNVPLRSWASGSSDHFVQIAIGEVSGRRIGSVA